MTEPLEYRILKNLQEALRGISKTSGYFHNVEKYAVKLDPEHDVEALVGELRERPFMILEVPRVDHEHVEQASRVRVSMPFIVHFVSDTDPKDDDSKLKTYMRLCADVETAVAQDPTRGELAMDTLISHRELREREGQGQEAWAMVHGTIRVHRGYGAPNG